MGDIINIGKAFNELSEKEQEEFVDKFFDEKSEDELWLEFKKTRYWKPFPFPVACFLFSHFQLP